MELRRYDMETDEELIYRICSMKEEIGTWEEVGSILNELLDQNYSESKYRKAYQSFQKMLDANQSKFVDSESQMEELENLKDELRKERIKLQTCNIERNRINRQDARLELWYEQVGQYIKQLEMPELKELHIRKTKKKYIQTIADIHYGAEFVSATNEYSPKIVKDRFEILKAETIEFIKEKGLEELTIVGLSDYVQGILRLNDLRINDSTVVKSVVEVARLVANYINDLSAYCKIYYYDCTYGNHQQIRYLGSSANAMMNEDLGYVISNYIYDLLIKNTRVEIILPKEDDTFVEIKNIFDFNIIAGHGHQITNIQKALADLSMQRRIFYDFLLLGHFHNDKNYVCGESYANDTEILIAPSIVGSDPYSDSLFKGAKSASAIYGFDEVFGHTETYKIVLN